MSEIGLDSELRQLQDTKIQIHILVFCVGWACEMAVLLELWEELSITPVE
jgi:hypothetical protein